MKNIKNYFVGAVLQKEVNEFSKARIHLVFNVLAFFFVLGIGFLGKLWADGMRYQFFLSLFGQSVLISAFVAMRRGNISWGAWAILINHLVIALANIYLLEARIVLTAVVFNLMFVLFTFLALGNRVGLVIMGITVAMMVVQLVEMQFPGSIVNWSVPQEMQLKDDVFAVLVPMAVITYILYISTKVRSAAEKQISRQRDELHEKNNEITDSINYAKRIQEAILPPDSLISIELPDSFVFYQPKDIVAGDFYWMEAVEDYTIFAAADCTGHGVPGAMVSVVCHNALNRAVREFGLRDAGKILDKVRELVLETFEKSEHEVKDGMDIALCIMKKGSTKLQYAGAHNPLWVVRDQAIEVVKPDKQPVGAHEPLEAFTTHEIDLQKGDRFYIFSDGLPDQFGGPRGKKFTYKRFREMLIELGGVSMPDQARTIKQ